MERARLIKTKEPRKLPIGTLGTVVDGTLNQRGMMLIKWDTGHLVPMYRYEVERA